MKEWILENETLQLVFDAEKGTLTGMTAVQTGWKILDRPQLGLSFCLMVPLPGRRDNLVRGEQQSPDSAYLAADRRSAVFTWNTVVSEHGGRHDISITIKVEMTGRQAVFSIHIDNRSDLTVETVFFPCLGDVRHPADAKRFQSFMYMYANAQEWPLWPSFHNSKGYYGVDFPTQYGAANSCSGAPNAPYILLRSDEQGLYAGVCSPSSELVAWQSELHPGYGNSMDACVPDQMEITGKAVATRFAAVHVPYVMPGESRSLTPVAFEAFQGGWQQGVDIYKNWLGGWMKTPEIPGWAKEPHAWQQLHINSPEDELRIRFADLPEIGRECAENGIRAIQLVGWNDGGQDRGNPSHDPDPRLGSFDELREAIAKIQKMGVKVILFSKFTWADRSTERFRSDLVRLAIKDPYGDYYMHPGYQYQTAAQLLDINTRRLIPMCFLSEEYLSLCGREFMKTVELGADGILFDECLHHANALLCFDPAHGHRPGAPVYANDRKLIENFKGMLPEGKEFLFAGEACYDWEFEAYHLSYHRSENRNHIPLSRYVVPRVPLMTAVTGFNDRNMINQCLLDRYIISYEPFNFKGRLSDFPETLAYGKKMDQLRTELRDYFWDGEFRSTRGAEVTGPDGTAHHPFSVFISQKGRKTGLVICNYDERNSITVHAKLDSGEILSRYRLVDESSWMPASEGIFLPPASAAAVIG